MFIFSRNSTKSGFTWGQSQYTLNLKKKRAKTRSSPRRILEQLVTNILLRSRLGSEARQVQSVYF